MIYRVRLDDYYELLALHKVLLEAKFHPDPQNLDIAGSPFVAKLEDALATAAADPVRG